MTAQGAVPEWLLDILQSAETPKEACARLLFHGTIEKFEGPLTASQWEALRWTAEDPCVAQSYCPDSGLSSGWSKPAAYQMAERMLPEGEINQAIFRDLGFDEAALDAERDHLGRFLSWRVLPDHPTWGDACGHLESLGYDLDGGYCWIKTKLRGDGTMSILPQAHKAPGRLFILERPADLRILDHSNACDGGLTGRQWMQTDVFKTAAADGRWDGIKIDDVHQSPRLGHFSHPSIGLFEPTLARLRHHVIDAVSFDPGDLWDRQGDDAGTTPEFDALWASCRAAEPLAA